LLYLLNRSLKSGSSLTSHHHPQPLLQQRRPRGTTAAAFISRCGMKLNLFVCFNHGAAELFGCEIAARQDCKQVKTERVAGLQLVLAVVARADI
jgi:hypothetical protein